MRATWKRKYAYYQGQIADCCVSDRIVRVDGRGQVDLRDVVHGIVRVALQGCGTASSTRCEDVEFLMRAYPARCISIPPRHVHGHRYFGAPRTLSA